MKGVIIALAIFVGLLVLGFIAWLTGGSFMGFVAGVFLLGLASVLLAGMARIVTLPSPVITLIGWAIMICIVVILWTGGSHWWEKYSAEKALQVQQEEQRRATNRLSPPPSTRVMVQKVGKVMQLYRFADFPNDCAPMELHSDASFYPKGGTVTIHPPGGGAPWEDTPGVPSTRNNTRQPPGWYMVCKKDPGAWGVEIWN